MRQNFQFSALADTEFAHLFPLSDAQLAARGVQRLVVDKKPGFPCRVSLADAEIGEEVLLLPYAHHAVESPYRASGPIFVRRNVPTASFDVNEIPSMLRHRLLSVRAYNTGGWMLEARVTEGQLLEETLLQLFENPNVAYLHIHNAKPGCYNCAVKRV